LTGLIITGSIIILTIRYNNTGFLSKTDKVENANILVFEGWLPTDACLEAFREFKTNKYDLLVTTGLNSQEYCLVSMDGYLIFYLKNKFLNLDDSDSHIIEVTAYSELEGDNCAHFNLFVNDSMVKSFFADKTERKYGILWKNTLQKIDSIMIQFDNDAMGDFGDRNLYVKEITVDNKLVIPFQKNSEYDISAIDGIHRFVYNYNSLAEIARFEFLSMGLDSLLVKAVPGGKSAFNKTLTSVLAFRDWLAASGINVQGINIVSKGEHARRTWLIYKKVLDKSYDIGVIAIPEDKNNYSKRRRLYNTFREIIGIIYYRIILIPY
jgi:hypothetical protein